MALIKRFAIQHPYKGVAEDESCARIIAAAAAMGVEARVFKHSGDIIDYAPDFVLLLSHQDPKLTPFPTYGVMTAPVKWYETPRFIRNILTYDGYLTVTPNTRQWLEDLCFGARKIDTSVAFYANTVACLDNASTPDFKNAALVYVGTNWDGDRHASLFQALKATPFMSFFGPEKSWTGYGSAYKGFLPFDGASVLSAYNKAGVGLCIEHNDFTQEGIPTNRIFETIASGALAICSRTAFNENWFGDNVLYVDLDAPPNELSGQIAAHMGWIKENPEPAQAMAEQAQHVYRDKLAPDKMLANLFDYHAANLKQKHYVRRHAASDAEPKVGVIMRAGGRGEKHLERSIGSVARQSFKNITLYLVLWGTPPGLDAVLQEFPGLAVVRVQEIGGGRSDCLWAGLRAAKSDDCELIGILDDDDEYHENMIGTLVAGYRYHLGLSLPDKVTVITGGSLIGFEAPIQHYFEDMIDDVSLPRPETRFIKQFHFGGRGRVHDKPFIASPSAMLMVVDFFDTEVMENPRLDLAEDYYLWLQLAERGRTAFIPEIISTVHEHCDGQSGYREQSVENNHQHMRIAKRVLGRRYLSDEPYQADKPLINTPCDTSKANHVFARSDQNAGLGPAVSLETLIRYHKIWLYGAGNFARLVKQVLDEKKLEVAGVADTYQTGLWQGYTLLNPRSLQEQLSPNHAIIIASDYWHEISQLLRRKAVSVDLFTVKDILFVRNEMSLRPIP